MRISGIILAGGQGSRLEGQDKGWIELAGRPMLDYILTRLRPQVDEVMINANRNIDRYMQFNYRVIEDEIKGFQGPLAGILCGLKESKNELLVCVPCDTPFFPSDLVTKMYELQKTNSADIVSVSDGERVHPVFALIKTSLKHSLETYLDSGERKIDRWYQQHDYHVLEYPNGENYFENINTQGQLQIAEQRIITNG